MFSKYQPLAILGLCMASSLFAQVQDPFLRYPSISPDAKTVAFSYQGDIWTVPSEGGRAMRLTLNEAYEALPLWSPDGKQIAFNGDRFGNNDVFVIDAQGSTPKRLTFLSRSDSLSSWTHDGHLLFSSARFLPFNWEEEVYQVPVAGGTPTRLMAGLGEMARMSPNGKVVAFVRGVAKNDRKRYRGPANLEIWTWHVASDTYHQITNFDGNDFRPIWSGDNELVFISEADGTYNLYKVATSNNGAATGEPQAVTQFKEDGVRYFDIAKDGTMVLEKDTHIYRLTAGGDIQKIEVTVPADSRFLSETARTFSSGLRNVAVSPKEDFLSLMVRGEVFLIKNDPKKGRTVRLTHHPFRDRDIEWHGEEAIVFASDRMGGQYDLFTITSAEEDQPSLYKALDHKTTRLTKTDGDERSPVVSPDGKKIVFTRGGNQMIVAEFNEDHQLGKETVLFEGWNLPGDIVWSPDSQWLAYTQQDLEFNAEIFIQAADGSKGPVNITFHPRNDHSPVWSKDGSKLAFISARNNGDDDVWFVWLRREDWEKTKADWDEDEDEEPKKSADKGKKSKEKDDEKEDAEAEDRIQIDFNRIHERLTQVTSLPGDEGDVMISKDGESFFFISNNDVYKIKWDGTEQKKVTGGGKRGGTLFMGPEYKYLYFVQAPGKISRIDTKKLKKESLSYSAKMKINHVAERQQIFNEGWRALNQSFYDPGFHGVDWDAMNQKYKAWAMKASTDQDFQDVFNMMLGELNASHMGFRMPDRYDTANERTGYLGIEVTPEKNGVRITKVLPYGPADREKSRLYVGEIITAVDGEPIRQNTNFYMLMKDTVNERVRLEVRNNKGVERRVVIRPTSSLRTLLYEDFVESRRQMVSKLSNGRLGYVHVRGMNWPSFEAFETAMTAEGHGKDGMVIDVRYNGGGWTTDYLLSVLSVKQHAYTIPRGATDDLTKNHSKFEKYYPYSERLPLASWPGPAITLCNQFSYSNAEIFSHAFQSLGRGTLVGAPTFGAVISTGGVGLMGGSFVRMPFRGWFVKKTGQNMENGPAVPDLLVTDPPGDLLNGKDPQLEAAVKQLLSEINVR